MKCKQIFIAFFAIILTAYNANAHNTGEVVTPKQMLDAFHSAFGKQFAKTIHAQGIILEGEFIPATQAVKLSKAFHLQKQNSKIILRFSDFASIPNIANNADIANPRGLAIKFIMPNGQNTDIIAHSFNGFPTATVDEFRQLLLAVATSGPNAAKPTPLDKFLNNHPITKKFLATQKTPASFASIDYFGVNTFKLTNKNGQVHYVRYQFIPEAGEQLLTKADFAKQTSDYLFKEITNRIVTQPVRFKLFAEIAEKGDKIYDPSIAWPNTRQKVLLGTIIINKLASNTIRENRTLSFMPNNIPNGIQIADRMLDFRARSYSIAARER